MSIKTPLDVRALVGLALGASVSSLLVSSGRILTYEEAKEVWPYVAVAVVGVIISLDEDLKYVGTGAFAYGLAKAIVKVVSKTWNVEKVS